MMEAQMPGKQQDRVKRDLRESGKTGDHKMGQLQTPLRGGGRLHCTELAFLLLTHRPWV